jgi:hypothetical protein
MLVLRSDSKSKMATFASDLSTHFFTYFPEKLTFQNVSLGYWNALEFEPYTSFHLLNLRNLPGLEGPSWLWLFIYNYLYLSPPKLWVWTPFMARMYSIQHYVIVCQRNILKCQFFRKISKKMCWQRWPS